MAYVSIPSILENINIPVYVVGSAYDGPDTIPFNIGSNVDLLHETISLTIPITKQTSGVTLTLPPSSGTVQADFLPWDSPRFTPTTWVSGNTLGIKSVGSSGTLFLKYVPYQEEDSILSVAQQLSLPDMYAVRVPGTQATGFLCGWTFTAEYSGEYYNGILVSGSANTLIVSGTNFLTEVKHGGDLSTLISTLDEYRMQDLPFSYESAITIPTGYTYFSGGRNGSLSETSLSTIVESLGGGYMGILCPACKISKQQIMAFQEINATLGYPMVLVASPINSDITGIPKTSDVILVYGDFTTSVGVKANLPASIDYLKFIYEGKTLFNDLGNTKLEILARQGIIGFSRYGPYINQALDGSQPLYKMIIGWILRNNYSGLIGQRNVSLTTIDKEATSELKSYAFVKDATVVSRRVRDYVEVGASVLVYGNLQELIVNVRAK